MKTASKTYGLAGKTVAQRTAAGGTVRLAFILSDGVDTAQTIVQASSGATPVTAQTRYTDPVGLARGPTQTAAGAGAYATAAGATTGVGSNAANPAGYGAVNGYIGGLTDTISTLTHLGARDLDPVLGAFTSPDPVLDPTEPNKYSPYAYAGQDPVNHRDPSGLDWGGDDALALGGLALAGVLIDWFSTQLSAHPIQMPSFQLPTIHWPWEQQSSSGTSAAEPSSSYPAIPASADSTISFDRPMVGSIGADDGYVADYPQATGTYFPAIPQRPSSTNDHGARNDGAALAAANAIMHAASQAATAAVGNANLASAAAAKNGAEIVRLGQAGEDAVRGAFDIGLKKAAEIDGRKRIFDGLTDEAVSEVKNVARQSFTRQLKDSLKFAKDTGRVFDLYVRGGANPTTLSGPLQDAIADTPRFNLKFIP